MKEATKFKNNSRVKHLDTGVWRQGVFEGKSVNPNLGIVMFEDAPTIGGEPIAELVRLDELEEVKE